MSGRTTIILSGAPGRMACEIARTALEPEWTGRIELAPIAVGSPSRCGSTIELAPGYAPELVSGEQLPGVIDRESLHHALLIDYTTPTVALDNIRCYIGADISFVMGTTGFDRPSAVRLVENSSINAVIAPNMAAPIVALQALLTEAARRFPGVLDGYQLEIQESHQAAKRDVSGTARAFEPLLQQLGAHPAGIQSIREPDRQRELGVPEAALAGHGWHWYAMRSQTGDVMLDFSHRINGRRVYAEGSLRAAEFLGRHHQRLHGRVFSMIDVLESR